MIVAWLIGGRVVEVRCDIDIAQTPETFHAHAIPDGIDIRPGDVVTVHDAPSRIGFGERFNTAPSIIRCDLSLAPSSV